jgi:uncharacterized peroxidase-related enzyme
VREEPGAGGGSVGVVAEDVSRFPVVELGALPDDLRERVAAVADKSGFVPNVFRALGHRPAELRAFMDYHDTVMERDSGLSKAERELVVVATSGANSCTYCVVAHGAILRIRARNPRLADQVATDWRKAEIDHRQRAVLEVAIQFTREPWTVTPAVLESLRAHGLSEDDIWDVGAISAFFAMSNRLVHLTGTMPNEEFYLMGRVPRSREDVGDATVG